MKDYACERLYRDARITNIYEGTTQLQVVAAIRHVLTGTYLAQMKEYQSEQLKPELESLKSRLAKMVEIYEQIVTAVSEIKDNEYIDFQARRLVESAGHIIMGYLMLSDANRDPEQFRTSAEVYINYGEAEVKKNADFIHNFCIDGLTFYKQV